MPRVYFDPETGELVEAAAGDAGVDPITGEPVDAPEEPEGPSPTQPFRFTQQALSGQATGAAGGIDQRVAMARSPISSMYAGKAGPTIMGLPTKAATFGRGEGAWSGHVFDINLIGQQMGIGQERINEILAMNPTQQTTYTIGERERAIQQFKSREDAEDFIKARSGGIVSPHGEEYDFSEIKSHTRAVPVQGLSDEEALLRGLAATYADPRTGTMQAFSKPGSKAAGEDIMSLLRLGRYHEVIDPESMTKGRYEDLRRNQDRWFREQGQQEGDDLSSTIFKSIAMAIPAVVGSIITWGAASPALIGAYGTMVGGAMAGGLAGMAGGAMSSLTQGITGGELTAGGFLKNVGIGGLTGAIGGGIGGAFGGAPVSSAQTTASGPFGAIGRAARAGQGISAGLYSAPSAVGASMFGGFDPASLTFSPAELEMLRQGGTAGAVSAVQAGGATSSGISAARGVMPETNTGSSLFSRIGSVVQSPAGKVIGKGIEAGVGGYQQAQAEAAMMAQMNQQIGGVVAPVGSQSRAAGMTRQQRLASIFQDNPFYDPVDDFTTGQAGVVA